MAEAVWSVIEVVGCLAIVAGVLLCLGASAALITFGVLALVGSRAAHRQPVEDGDGS